MTSEKRVHLIAGLGNPGDTYKKTRHNAGFMAVDAVADTYSIPVEKKKFDALIGRGRIQGREVILAKPMSFMNRSGFPIQSIANYFRISSKDMLIIHDDIDLAFGRIKIKEKGGDGGHKGLRSLIAAFGGGEFARLRIGVGRSEIGMSVPDYVLAKFDADEIKEMEQIIIRARDAVVTILCKGAKEGMNRFNKKNIII
ncbi:aminoacyl-tRNA hydrolase [Desulfonema magnum]|uniref:Peptidyl-tRNA hydrolase n=1 Tax=Desulfonema magnum TaxID=45655 RepID=A0A975GS95_9BACT|nr:aminoacyl-tRNA hydrolase [Desulfonema magnum]QTA91799.1 Peptidyl-tRNA hydrolase [Desulfonema magnum]